MTVFTFIWLSVLTLAVFFGTPIKKWGANLKTKWSNFRKEKAKKNKKEADFSGPKKVLAYAVVVFVIVVLAVFAYRFAAGLPIFG